MPSTGRAAQLVKSVEQVRFITRVADARVEREGRDAQRKVAEGAAKYEIADIDALIAELEDDARAAEDLDLKRPRGCATKCSS
jgi:hypothetical protein